MPRSAPKPEPEPKTFEPSLRELERTVASLESGRLDLDDALSAYERGVRLLARCKGLLDAAERQAAILTGVDAEGLPQTAPLDASSAEAPPRSLAPNDTRPADDDLGEREGLDDLPF